ncbi:hypothetical protein Tco_0719313 [Tanacetum coccineum]
MEDEFYHLTVKGNDLKAYVRRFQELATLCPTMVPDSEKMMEVCIERLPRSIKGNVTTSKPQTLEEAINIAQRLIDQVMHAYYAKESPIPPPTIMPPSIMLSPMFNPQEFFLPKELLSPKKQGHNQSFSSTSALPQEFEMRESSRKTSLERHKEQIEEILNHLDELSLSTTLST